MTLNWYAGWILLLASFASGAAIGLFFHREEFWGGYGSFRRRIVRLGHIACAALGMLNLILFAAAGHAASQSLHAASVLLVAGGASMAAVCFLSGWRASFRHLFFIPVTSLTLAVALVLYGGLP